MKILTSEMLILKNLNFRVIRSFLKIIIDHCNDTRFQWYMVSHWKCVSYSVGVSSRHIQISRSRFMDRDMLKDGHNFNHFFPIRKCDAMIHDWNHSANVFKCNQIKFRILAKNAKGNYSFHCIIVMFNCSFNIQAF